MCQLGMVSFLESAFYTLSPYISALIDKVKLMKCRVSALLYNPESVVTLSLPIEASLEELFDTLEIDYSDEDTMITEFYEVSLKNVAVEVYLFFNNYDSQSSELFHELSKLLGYDAKPTYTMETVTGNTLVLYTDKDELYCKYI